MVDGLYILTQNRTKKPLAIVLSGWGGGRGGETAGAISAMYNISLFGIVTMNYLCTTNIS
jgi:hypothetical protein